MQPKGDRITPQTDDALNRAKAALKAGRLDEAIAAAESVLEARADDEDGLYLLAVAARYAKAWDQANAALNRLITHHPHHARAFQERGHLAKARGLDVPSMAAYARAVSLNPALIASWQALVPLYAQAGLSEKAEQARAQADRFAALPPELVSVTSFLHEGRLQKAEKLCRAFLKKQPHHPEAMRLLAVLGVRLQVLDDAEFLLESCLELHPEFILARIDYVDVLQKRQKFGKALEEAQALLATNPQSPAFRAICANAQMALGDHESALALYESLSGTPEEMAPVHLSRGHALKTLGRQDEAVRAYRQASAARPEFGDAYWSLANLKTYRFTDDHIETMHALVERPDMRPEDRYHLCFALGKAHEDAGNFATAFDYYTRGNTLKKNELRYDADRMEAELTRQIEHCTPELFAKHAGRGHAAPDPIFIVGLPRAGSTLLEQILASHSLVDGTLELPNILAMAHRLNGRRLMSEEPLYPANLYDLTTEQCAALGQTYIDETRLHRKKAPYFTDKMPNNFRHIGLIHLMLPNAKIIDARRNAMSCCFSSFKQLFAEGQEFSYDLTDLGRYYRDYVRLMAHWDRILPGKVLRVQYEDVVRDLEEQVRRLLDFCDLPFEPACIAFHETKRAVRTASSEQVRQPIYTSGVDQWRGFAPYLEPLRMALGPDLAEPGAEQSGGTA